MRPSPRFLKASAKPTLTVASQTLKTGKSWLPPLPHSPPSSPSAPLPTKLYIGDKRVDELSRRKRQILRLPSHYGIASYFEHKFFTPSEDNSGSSSNSNSNCSEDGEDNNIPAFKRVLSDSPVENRFSRIEIPTALDKLSYRNQDGAPKLLWESLDSRRKSVLDKRERILIPLDDVSKDERCPLVIFTRTTSERFYQVANSNWGVVDEKNGGDGGGKGGGEVTKSPPPLIVIGRNDVHIDPTRLRQGTTVLKMPAVAKLLLESERKSRNWSKGVLAQVLGLDAASAMVTGTPEMRRMWRRVATFRSGYSRRMERLKQSLANDDINRLDQLLKPYMPWSLTSAEKVSDSNGERDDHDGHTSTTIVTTPPSNEPNDKNPGRVTSALEVLTKYTQPNLPIQPFSTEDKAILLWTRDRLIEEFYPTPLTISKTSNCAASAVEYINVRQSRTINGPDPTKFQTMKRRNREIANIGSRDSGGRSVRDVSSSSGDNPINKYADVVRSWRVEDFFVYIPPGFPDLRSWVKVRFPSQVAIEDHEGSPEEIVGRGEEEGEGEGGDTMVLKDDDLVVSRWLARYTETVRGGVSVRINRKCGEGNRKSDSSSNGDDSMERDGEIDGKIDVLFRVGIKARQAWAYRIIAKGLLERFPGVKVEVIYD